MLPPASWHSGDLSRLSLLFFGLISGFCSTRPNSFGAEFKRLFLPCLLCQSLTFGRGLVHPFSDCVLWIFFSHLGVFVLAYFSLLPASPNGVFLVVLRIPISFSSRGEWLSTSVSRAFCGCWVLVDLWKTGSTFLNSFSSLEISL